MNREREIVKASIYGIIGNALLVAFKMAVGFMSHSIAIILDGVNNATDALSSIVTIVGTKLAGRRLRPRGVPHERRHRHHYPGGRLHLPARVHRQDHPPRHPQLLGHHHHRHRGGHPREDRHRHHVQALRRQNELRGPHRLRHRFQL